MSGDGGGGGERGDVRVSGNKDDTSDELEWTVIDRRPTFGHLRKGGVAVAPEGNVDAIDVGGMQRLGAVERRNLLERLVRIAEEDNKKFLQKIKNRMECVGLENPTIEVRFEDLNVNTEAYVGDRRAPTIVNSFRNKIEDALNFLHLVANKKRLVPILHGLTGLIRPSRMTLLLGGPGSGKTTLLLALAGRLDSSVQVSGRITYNGHDFDEFVPQKTSAYVSQNDVHIGRMTVRETLAFSARCQGTGSRHDTLMELLERECAANIKPDPDIDLFMKASSCKGQEGLVTDYIMKILGLEVCADTMVGDQMTRGISGGQRKRLTTGEVLVGPAKMLFMDEISNGLDSSTTFQIINSLKQSVHILDGTALVALLQPAPEIYELFDDIILLSEGRIVYQGPCSYVVQFFESMGFKCPKRKGVADFLQEVLSEKDQHQYWALKDGPYRFIPIEEFVDAFKSFHVGRNLQLVLGTPFDKKKNHPAALVTTSTHCTSKMEMIRTCMSREYLLMKRNSFVYIFKLFQLSIIAVVTMTLFLRTTMHHHTIVDAGIYLGALFVGLIVHLFNGFAELSMSLVRLPVFYKQRDLRFYPAWAYAIPACILKVPISVIECAVWTGLTYYAIGFDPNIQRMLKQYLVFLMLSQMAFGLFRFLAALGRDVVISYTLGSFSLILLTVLGGFALTRRNIPSWWIWGYWSSPLMYAQNSIAVNEFLGDGWSHVLNPRASSETLGLVLLKAQGYFSQSHWYWIGIGGLLGYILILNGLFVLALTFLDPIRRQQNIISDESLVEAEIKRTRKPTKLVAQGEVSDGVVYEEDTYSSKKGMILPFVPLSVTFRNIKYFVDSTQEKKAEKIFEDRIMLLNDLNGAFRPGVLTALMGVTGAGKTTLMDVLAGRKTGGYIEGNITISGYPKKQETFNRISGYCEQNDVHSPHVTVYESLLYSAWLRLPPEVDFATRKMFIEEVMKLVELGCIREAMVGLPGVDGLSIEQRKRLTIAVELVANPSIIFMDEPTSGLDARTAAIVMRTVRNTVDTGRTVVCTIHQPSIDIFESFDELFLMKQGGEEIYVGPLGHNSCQLIKYFEAITGVPRIREGCNPATWMLEVTSMSQEENLDLNFTDIYKTSELFERNISMIGELSQPTTGSEDLHFPTLYSQSFLGQCIACLWKQYKSYWRNPSYNATRIFFTIITALLFGTVAWRTGSNVSSRQGLQNATGSIYAAVVFLGIKNSQMVQPIVDIERTVFYREKSAGMYSALPYAVGQIVIEIPYVFLQALMYGAIVYKMINLELTLTKFLWILFLMFTSFLYFTFYGMMVTALTPNSTIAAVVSSIFYNLWSIFAGFIIPQPRIPIWWRWYYWASPVSWTLYGLLSSQFGNVKDVLESGEEVGEYMSSYYGYKHDFLGVVAIVSVLFDFLFAMIFAYAIKVLNFQKR